MTPEEKYELFEKFCGNELSINEKARLNKLFDEDDAVKKEFQLYKELHSHLDTNLNTENEQAALTDSLKKLGDNYFAKKPEKKVVKEAQKEDKEKVKKQIETTTTKKPKVIKIPAWSYAVAASVAIIFGVYFFSQSSPVYNDFATIPELSISERGDAAEMVKNAENAFNSKKYVVAEKYLSELISRDKNNAEYQFYYGISLLQQDKYSNATAIFKKLYQGNSVYKYKSIWFEALNQLKQKKYDQCAELLKTLPEDAEDYKQAQKLLKKLQ